jgi:hypothetical protein
MKTLLLRLSLVAASAMLAFGNTAFAAPADSVIKGEVLEATDVGGYTYLRLKTRNGETWAAIERAPVAKGTTVTIEHVNVMDNFTSKSLNRTFKSIAFGNLAGGGDAAHLPRATGGTNPHSAATPDAPDIRVAKATGANAWTVAEVITKAAALAGKPVQVRGRVVKVNAGIMGRNWVHLRDGSGSSANQTHDLLVTSAGEVKVGDVVTAKGVLHTDRNFGSGYAFKVVMEEAIFQQ